MSAKWWPDAGADLSNLGTLQSSGTTLCVFILHIPAGAAQNRAVSWLSPALAWCQGEFWHWFQRGHAWSLSYEEKKKSKLGFLRKNKEYSIHNPDPWSCYVLEVPSHKTTHKPLKWLGTQPQIAKEMKNRWDWPLSEGIPVPGANKTDFASA